MKTMCLPGYHHNGFEMCSMGGGWWCDMGGMGVTDGEWVIWMRWQMLMEVGEKLEFEDMDGVRQGGR